MNTYFSLNDRKIDKVRLVSILLNLLLLFSTGLFAWLYFTKPCPPCTDGQIVRIQRDTIYRYTQLQQVPVSEPVAYRTVKAKGEKAKPQVVKPSKSTPLGIDTNSIRLGDIYNGKIWFVNEPDPIPNHETPCPIIANECDYVNFYTDTLWKQVMVKKLLKKEPQLDSVPVFVVNYQVQGLMLSRELWQADYSMETRENTTVLRRERWKFYVGAQATYNVPNVQRWGIGPAADLAIPKVGLISYYYDIHNNAHSAGFKALLRLKK